MMWFDDIEDVSPEDDPRADKRIAMLRALSRELNAIPMRRENDRNAYASQGGLDALRASMESQSADNMRNISPQPSQVDPRIFEQAQYMRRKDVSGDHAMRYGLPTTAIRSTPMQASVAPEGPTPEQRDLKERFAAFGAEALSQPVSSVHMGTGGATGAAQRAKLAGIKQADQQRYQQAVQARQQRLAAVQQLEEFKRTFDPRDRAKLVAELMNGRRLDANAKTQQDQFQQTMAFNERQKGMDRTFQSQQEETNRQHDLEKLREAMKGRGIDLDDQVGQWLSTKPMEERMAWLAYFKGVGPKPDGSSPPATPRTPPGGVKRVGGDAFWDSLAPKPTAWDSISEALVGPFNPRRPGMRAPGGF